MLFRSKPGVFDLKDFVCYYHESARRKGVVSMINASGGRSALNLSVQLCGSRSFPSAQKLILSKQRVNLIVCDEPLIREIVHLFLLWREH